MVEYSRTYWIGNKGKLPWLTLIFIVGLVLQLLSMYTYIPMIFEGAISRIRALREQNAGSSYAIILAPLMLLRTTLTILLLIVILRGTSKSRMTEKVIRIVYATTLFIASIIMILGELFLLLLVLGIPMVD